MHYDSWAKYFIKEKPERMVIVAHHTHTILLYFSFSRLTGTCIFLFMKISKHFFVLFETEKNFWVYENDFHY